MLDNRLIPLKDAIENKEENTKCGLQLAEIRKIQDSIAQLTCFEDFAAWYSDNPNTSKEIKEKSILCILFQEIILAILK